MNTIAVEDLRIGMYIHLEGGWLSHPFALSSFRIATPDQIGTLRRLGLARVGWVPEKSDTDAVGSGSGSGTPEAPVATSQTPADAQRSDWLAAQRAAAQRCEQQYGEAARVWHEMNKLVAVQPEQAGCTSAELTRAMLDKMLGNHDVGIRLINAGGDRNAAHALNVAVISLLIGRSLNLDEAEMLDLGVGALLHDVGKLDIAERVRHEEQGFSAAEINAYRDHVPRGVAHGQRMLLAPGALAVLSQHHEHADGSGFPHRLVADRMGIAARIVSIVNRYDNLCNPGSRAVALTPHEAVAMLFAQGRARYDAPVLNAFIRMMGVYPAGSLVQLTDDRYALVVGINSSRPLKPRVLVHGMAPVPGVPATDGPARGSASTELVDLEAVPDLGIRRSLGAARLPAAALKALDPRPRVSYYFEPLSPPPEQRPPP